MHDYFNFDECTYIRTRVEAEETQTQITETDKRTKKSTSYTEYEVDALALKTEEGRGDRRNVQGELHPSDEP
jgi:hypothetical protein